MPYFDLQGINRTFMELKSLKLAPKAKEAYGINRTFMELKCSRVAEGIATPDVLIEPLWN